MMTLMGFLAQCDAMPPLPLPPLLLPMIWHVAMRGMEMEQQRLVLLLVLLPLPRSAVLPLTLTVVQAAAALFLLPTRQTTLLRDSVLMIVAPTPATLTACLVPCVVLFLSLSSAPVGAAW
jgi:hypothetical protein